MPMSWYYGGKQQFLVDTCSPEDRTVVQTNGKREDEATSIREPITTVWT